MQVWPGDVRLKMDPQNPSDWNPIILCQDVTFSPIMVFPSWRAAFQLVVLLGLLGERWFVSPFSSCSRFEGRHSVITYRTGLSAGLCLDVSNSPPVKISRCVFTWVRLSPKHAVRHCACDRHPTVPAPIGLRSVTNAQNQPLRFP
jgi:hypothetical protein